MLLNRAYKDLYGYVPLTDRQINYYVNMYIPMLRLNFLSLVLREEDNKVVGVGIGLPSLAKALQKAEGKFLPTGWYHIYNALKGKNNKVLDLLLIGVDPEYQGKGVNALIFSQFIPEAIDLGFEYAESNPELENNGKVRSMWEDFNADASQNKKGVHQESLMATRSKIFRWIVLIFRKILERTVDKEVAESDKNLLSTIGDYQEENIVTLEWQEHIRRRPGMYIGKLGDGSSYDDGIYVLLKEVLDNSIDEFMMGFGKTIEVKIEGTNVSVRDYGRGVPLGKVKDISSKMNTGAKYDSKAFKKSVGLNGVGIKAVNALSSRFLLKVIVMADRVVWNTNAELWFVKRLRMLQAKATARSCRLRPIPKYSTDMLIGNNLLSRCSKTTYF